jgi:NitT/TauT family transport system ATP-binding protein
VRIEGQRLTRPRPRTGLVLQDFGLLPWATCEANIALGLRIHRFYGPDGKHAPTTSQHATITAITEHWLNRMELSRVRRHYPAQLSGGQRQRAAIARTLALHPDLLLMDEPFASLDAPTRESLQTLTLELRAEQNLTIIVVTHSIEEAAFLGQKILVLGHTPAIIENPAAGNAEYRGTAHYNAIIQILRERITPASALPRPQSARTGEGVEE